MTKSLSDNILRRKLDFKFSETEVDCINSAISELSNKSDSIFERFNASEQFEILFTLKVDRSIYDKNLFINDFKRYVNSKFKGLNKEVFDDFYKIYEDQQRISAENFFDDLRQYLHSHDHSIFGAYSDLLQFVESYSSNNNQFNNFLIANKVFRYLRSKLKSKSILHTNSYRSIPLKYIFHMYFDLVSTIKKAEDNNGFHGIVINNFFNLKEDGQKELFGFVAFPN